ncbi:MAG: hypothetical protein GY939_00970 [Actinomycetia bacterium]|nr:hypothetical protein [Actinomycetes bacterium]
MKRFINLYRIVKASHRKASIAGFSEGDGGFKAPLFLLAIICGNPKDADILFRYFVSADDTKTLVAVIREGEQQNHFFQQFNGAGDEGEHETILNRLKDTEIYPAGFNNMNNPDILAHIRIALKQKVGSQAWIHLSEVVRENADAINQLEMKTVKEWIPEVARFGYREWIE